MNLFAKFLYYTDYNKTYAGTGKPINLHCPSHLMFQNQCSIAFLSFSDEFLQKEKTKTELLRTCQKEKKIFTNCYYTWQYDSTTIQIQMACESMSDECVAHAWPNKTPRYLKHCCSLSRLLNFSCKNTCPDLHTY